MCLIGFPIKAYGALPSLGLYLRALEGRTLSVYISTRWFALTCAVVLFDGHSVYACTFAEQ
jgi:hypothetical protein